MKDKKRTAPFPVSLNNFARTLHFYSPRAYKFVRSSFLKCLPCIETLNCWDFSKNYKADISSEMVDHVNNIVKEAFKINKKLVFNLTFDEIHIKKCRFWNRNSYEWKGVVDTPVVEVSYQM